MTPDPRLAPYLNDLIACVAARTRRDTPATRAACVLSSNHLAEARERLRRADLRIAVLRK